MSEQFPLILQHVSRHFTQGGKKIQVLDNANLQVKSGQLTALVGPSGAGKTTLLNIAGLLEAPNSGKVLVAGQNTAGLTERKRTQLRKKHIGLVFQFHRLFMEFDALENVVIPQMIAGLKKDVAEERAEALLGMVGLQDRLHHRPGLLSGGEQQRVAIARAVANAPDILLADEPTGNLDPETAEYVFSALEKIVKGTQTAALIVTHNLHLASRMDRQLRISQGAIAEVR